MTGRDAILAPMPPPPEPTPNLKTLPNLVLSKFMTVANGLLRILLNPNLIALDANNAVNCNIFESPKVIAVKVPPIINSPVASFRCKLFSKSTLPSAFALIILIKVFVNQPPANIRKKSTNLCNTP